VCDWVLAELGMTESRFELIATNVAAQINHL
jgi:hypothetical protein